MDSNLLLIIQILFIIFILICAIASYIYFVLFNTTSSLNKIPIAPVIPVIKNNITNVDNFTYYDKSNYKYYGEPLLPDKCLKGVDLGNCLKTCNESSLCVGVEWNPVILEDDKNISKFCQQSNNQCQDDSVQKYYMSKNICCPLKKIDFKDIRDTNDNGNFYIKTNGQDSDKLIYVGI